MRAVIFLFCCVITVLLLREINCFRVWRVQDLQDSEGEREFFRRFKRAEPDGSRQTLSQIKDMENPATDALDLFSLNGHPEMTEESESKTKRCHDESDEDDDYGYYDVGAARQFNPQSPAELLQATICTTCQGLPRCTIDKKCNEVCPKYCFESSTETMAAEGSSPPKNIHEVISRMQQPLPDPLASLPPLLRSTGPTASTLKNTPMLLKDLSENEERWYTIGELNSGPRQKLLSQMLNIGNKDALDKLVILAKPKSRSESPSNPQKAVLIDTANVFHHMPIVNRPQAEENINAEEASLIPKMKPFLNNPDIDDVVNNALQQIDRMVSTARVSTPQLLQLPETTLPDLLRFPQPARIQNPLLQTLMEHRPTEHILGLSTLPKRYQFHDDLHYPVLDSAEEDETHHLNRIQQTGSVPKPTVHLETQTTVGRSDNIKHVSQIKEVKEEKVPSLQVDENENVAELTTDASKAQETTAGKPPAEDSLMEDLQTREDAHIAQNEVDDAVEHSGQDSSPRSSYAPPPHGYQGGHGYGPPRHPYGRPPPPINYGHPPYGGHHPPPYASHPPPYGGHTPYGGHAPTYGGNHPPPPGPYGGGYKMPPPPPGGHYGAAPQYHPPMQGYAPQGHGYGAPPPPSGHPPTGYAGPPPSYGGGQPQSYGGGSPQTYGGGPPPSYGGGSPQTYGGGPPPGYGGNVQYQGPPPPPGPGYGQQGYSGPQPEPSYSSGPPQSSHGYGGGDQGYGEGGGDDNDGGDEGSYGGGENKVDDDPYAVEVQELPPFTIEYLEPILPEEYMLGSPQNNGSFAPMDTPKPRPTDPLLRANWVSTQLGNMKNFFDRALGSTTDSPRGGTFQNESRPPQQTGVPLKVQLHTQQMGAQPKEFIQQNTRPQAAKAMRPALTVETVHQNPLQHLEDRPLPSTTTRFLGVPTSEKALEPKAQRHPPRIITTESLARPQLTSESHIRYIPEAHASVQHGPVSTQASAALPQWNVPIKKKTQKPPVEFKEAPAEPKSAKAMAPQRKPVTYHMQEATPQKSGTEAPINETVGCSEEEDSYEYDSYERTAQEPTLPLVGVQKVENRTESLRQRPSSKHQGPEGDRRHGLTPELTRGTAADGPKAFTENATASLDFGNSTLGCHDSEESDESYEYDYRTASDNDDTHTRPHKEKEQTLGIAAQHIGKKVHKEPKQRKYNLTAAYERPGKSHAALHMETPTQKALSEAIAKSKAPIINGQGPTQGNEFENSTVGCSEEDSSSYEDDYYLRQGAPNLERSGHVVQESALKVENVTSGSASEFENSTLGCSEEDSSSYEDDYYYRQAKPEGGTEVLGLVTPQNSDAKDPRFKLSNFFGKLIPVVETEKPSLEPGKQRPRKTERMNFVGTGVNLPLVMSQNKDGSFQLTLDLQRISRNTQSPQAPLPNAPITKRYARDLDDMSSPDFTTSVERLMSDDDMMYSDEDEEMDLNANVKERLLNGGPGGGNKERTFKLINNLTRNIQKMSASNNDEDQKDPFIKRKIKLFKDVLAWVKDVAVDEVKNSKPIEVINSVPDKVTF